MKLLSLLFAIIFAIIFSILVGVSSVAGSTVTIQPSEAATAIPTVVVPSPALKWKVRPGTGSWTRPAIRGDVIFLTTGNSSVAALDAETGATKWKFNAELASFEGTSPILAGDRVLFAGNDHKREGAFPDYEDTFTGYMYSLDAKTGEERWRFKADEERLTKAVVIDGFAYFGAGQETARIGGRNDQPRGAIYSVNVATGAVRWKLEIPDGDVWATPVVKNGVLYFIDRTGYQARNSFLYAIDLKTQREKWRLEIDDYFEDTLFDPVIAGDLIYVTGHYRLYAVNALTGKLKWSFDATRQAAGLSLASCCAGGNSKYLQIEKGAVHPIYATNVFTSIYTPQVQVSSPPTIVGGVAYFSVNLDNGKPVVQGYSRKVDFYLLGLDASTGKERWRYKSEEEVRGEVAIKDGVIYMTTDFPYLLQAIDIKSGQLKWQFELESFSIGPPVVSKGVVYVADYDRYFYAVLTEPVGMPKSGYPALVLVIILVMAIMSLSLGIFLRMQIGATNI
ncbi:MAG TPA: PQQ-binding-like beta-propeller repeat protein [Chloroflexia bacterium]